MFGLEKFRYYLYGGHTLVETDHSPLEQIFKKNIGTSAFTENVVEMLEVRHPSSQYKRAKATYSITEEALSFCIQLCMILIVTYETSKFWGRNAWYYSAKIIYTHFVLDGKMGKYFMFM